MEEKAFEKLIRNVLLKKYPAIDDVQAFQLDPFKYRFMDDSKHYGVYLWVKNYEENGNLEFRQKIENEVFNLGKIMGLKVFRGEINLRFV